MIIHIIRHAINKKGTNRWIILELLNPHVFKIILEYTLWSLMIDIGNNL